MVRNDEILIKFFESGNYFATFLKSMKNETDVFTNWKLNKVSFIFFFKNSKIQ